MIVLNILLNVIRLEGHFANLANRDLDCFPAKEKKKNLRSNRWICDKLKPKGVKSTAIDGVITSSIFHLPSTTQHNIDCINPIFTQPCFSIELNVTIRSDPAPEHLKDPAYVTHTLMRHDGLVIHPLFYVKTPIVHLSCIISHLEWLAFCWRWRDIAQIKDKFTGTETRASTPIK